MARVTIEDDAFGDTRYEVLARACGLADADHARGKMARIWRQCTAEGLYVLPIEDVESVLGVSAVDALVRARLGDVVEGGVRIRGTQGRIEWLNKLRNNGKFGKRGGRPRKNPDGYPQGFSNKTPLTLTLTPALVKEEEERESGKPDVAAELFSEPKKPEPDPAEILAQTACAEINRLTGSKYEPDSAATLRMCRKLAKAKHTPEEVVLVVRDKHREWGANLEMRSRVCPATLLALANFEKYLENLHARPGAKPAASGAIFSRPPALREDPPMLRMYPPGELARTLAKGEPS